ncbi:MAG: hypothetical protein IJ991_09625, partial [Thermoguttaceae bacterium]|nr:hypothetical protein [Thermoguttaceae bacterium]
MLAARPIVSRASRTFALLLALGFIVDAPSSAFAQTSKPRAASATRSTPKTAKVAQAPTARPTQTAPAAPSAAAPQTAPAADAPKLSAAEEAKYQEALQHFNSQNLAGALASLQDLAASNPAATPPRLILARWFAELQNPKAVRTSLELATEESPNDPEAFLSLAEISLLEGSLTAAELLTLQGRRVLEQYSANPTRKQNLTRKALTLQLAYSNAR